MLNMVAWISLLVCVCGGVGVPVTARSRGSCLFARPHTCMYTLLSRVTLSELTTVTS